VFRCETVREIHIPEYDRRHSNPQLSSYRNACIVSISFITVLCLISALATWLRSGTFTHQLYRKCDEHVYARIDVSRKHLIFNRQQNRCHMFRESFLQNTHIKNYIEMYYREKKNKNAITIINLQILFAFIIQVFFL